jgi:hypothetical protein
MFYLFSPCVIFTVTVVNYCSKFQFKLKGGKLPSQSREAIYNIHKFMKRESELSGNDALYKANIAVCRCEGRGAGACGVSHMTVQGIKGEVRL